MVIGEVLNAVVKVTALDAEQDGNDVDTIGVRVTVLFEFLDDMGAKLTPLKASGASPWRVVVRDNNLAII